MSIRTPSSDWRIALFTNGDPLIPSEVVEMQVIKFLGNLKDPSKYYHVMVYNVAGVATSFSRSVPIMRRKLLPFVRGEV